MPWLDKLSKWKCILEIQEILDAFQSVWYIKKFLVYFFNSGHILEIPGAFQFSILEIRELHSEIFTPYFRHFSVFKKFFVQFEKIISGILKKF